MEVVIHDDGTGFDVDAARKRAAAGGSLGMLSMEERVSLAGGRLAIESAPWSRDDGSRSPPADPRRCSMTTRPSRTG